MLLKKLYALLLFALFALTALSQQNGGGGVVTIFIVKAPGGAGVAHAAVGLDPAPDFPPGQTTKLETDGAGRLVLELKPGGYALSVSVPGFKQFATRIEVRDTNPVQTIPVVLEIANNSGAVSVTPTGGNGNSLVLSVLSRAPVSLSLLELRALRHITIMIHSPHGNARETYSGVRLADLLAQMGAPLGTELRGNALADYIVATGTDGYQAVFALAEIDPSFHPGEVIVADAMNGKSLDPHAGPLRLVVTEDKRPARSVRNLASIEVKSIK
jgi:hypothetical protein